MSATLSRFLRDCTGRYDAAKGKVATLFETDAMGAARFDGEENRYFHPVRPRKDLQRTRRGRAAEPPGQNFNARRGRTTLLKLKFGLRSYAVVLAS